MGSKRFGTDPSEVEDLVLLTRETMLSTNYATFTLAMYPSRAWLFVPCQVVLCQAPTSTDTTSYD